VIKQFRVIKQNRVIKHFSPIVSRAADPVAPAANRSALP
jgi:hypothetical protein